MADLESLGDQMTEAVGNALAKIISQLLSFRTALGLLDTVCSTLGGWIDSLAYRDAGERYLRGMFGAILPGIGFAAQSIGLTVILQRWPGPIFYVILVWAGALRIADWMSAMDRRKREATEGYTFSFFIGYCRFMPALRAGSYVWQAWMIVGAGALLALIDRVGGAMVVVAGVTLLVRQWIIRARWREDAMDALDSEWEATQRARAKVRAGGADLTGEDVATAQVISTADFIRHYSSGPTRPS